MFRTIEVDTPWYVEEPNDDTGWYIKPKTFKVVKKEEPFSLLELKVAPVKSNVNSEDSLAKEQNWYDLDNLPYRKPSETHISIKKPVMSEKKVKKKAKKKKKKKLIIVHNGKIETCVFFKGVWMLHESAMFLKTFITQLHQNNVTPNTIKEKLQELLTDASETFMSYKILYCKHCNANGHRKDRCPSKIDKNTKICYKCGSLQHNILGCPEPSSHLAFAKCTKCKEVGHEDYQCSVSNENK